MLSINQLKQLRALSLKKYRQQAGQFLVEGDKMVLELLNQNRIDTIAVYALQPWIDKQERLLRQFAGKFHAVTEIELGRISALSTPNQVLAVAGLPDSTAQVHRASTELCFYLDGIQDPGNMGSILRVADWFGMPAVFCSLECVDAYSPKVIQASMGAVFRIETWEIPMTELLNASPQPVLLGAVLEGENVFETSLPQHGLLVIGNEGKGISPEINALLTHRISIPRHREGKAESLNAAVAAGILAAAIRR